MSNGAGLGAYLAGLVDSGAGLVGFVAVFSSCLSSSSYVCCDCFGSAFNRFEDPAIAAETEPLSALLLSTSDFLLFGLLLFSWFIFPC